MASKNDSPQVSLNLNLNKSDANKVLGQIETLVSKITAALDKSADATKGLAEALKTISAASKSLQTAFDAIQKSTSKAIDSSVKAAEKLNAALEKTISLQERARAQNTAPPTPPRPPSNPNISATPGLLPIEASLTRADVVAKQLSRTISQQVAESLQKTIVEAQRLQKILESGGEVTKEQKAELAAMTAKLVAQADIEKSIVGRKNEVLSLDRQEFNLKESIRTTLSEIERISGSVTEGQRAILGLALQTDIVDKQRIESLKTGQAILDAELSDLKTAKKLEDEKAATAKKAIDISRQEEATRTRILSLETRIKNILGNVPKNLLDANQKREIQARLDAAAEKSLKDREVTLKRIIAQSKELIDSANRTAAASTEARQVQNAQKLAEIKAQTITLAKALNKEAEINVKLSEIATRNAGNENAKLKETQAVLSALNKEASGTFAGLDIGQYLTTDIRRGLLDLRDLGQSLRDIGRTGQQAIRPAVEAFVSFDQVIRTTKDLVGDDAAFKALEAQIRALPPEMGKLEDITRAVMSALQAGFGPQDAFAVASASIKTAIGNSVDYQQVLEGSLRVFSIYRESLSDINGTFSLIQQAADAGSSNLSDFANALPSFIGQAKEAGLTLNETLAVYAKLSTALGASKAAFSFGRLLQDLTGKSEAASKAAAEIGVELGRDVISKQGGLAQFLRYLNEKGIKDLEKVSEIFRETRGERGFLALGTEQSISEIEELTQALQGGALNVQRFDEVVSGAFGSTQRWEGLLDRLKNTIGAAAAPMLNLSNVGLSFADFLARTFPILTQIGASFISLGSYVAIAGGTIVGLIAGYQRLVAWSKIADKSLQSYIARQAELVAAELAESSAKQKQIIGMQQANISRVAGAAAIKSETVALTANTAALTQETATKIKGAAASVAATVASANAAKGAIASFGASLLKFASKAFIPITVGLVALDIAKAAWDKFFGDIKKDAEEPVVMKVGIETPDAPAESGKPDVSGRPSLKGSDVARLRAASQEEFNKVLSEYNVILKETEETNRSAAKMESDRNRAVLFAIAADRQHDIAIRELAKAYELDGQNSGQAIQSAAEELDRRKALSAETANQNEKLNELISKQTEFARVTNDSVKSLQNLRDGLRGTGEDDSFIAGLANSITAQGATFASLENARLQIEALAGQAGKGAAKRTLELTQLLNDQLGKNAKTYQEFADSMRTANTDVSGELTKVASSVREAMNGSNDELTKNLQVMSLVSTFAKEQFANDFGGAMKAVTAEIEKQEKAAEELKKAWHGFFKATVRSSEDFREKLDEALQNRGVAGETFDLSGFQADIEEIAEEFGITLPEAIKASQERFTEFKKQIRTDAKEVSSSIERLLAGAAKNAAFSSENIKESMQQVRETLSSGDSQEALSIVEALIAQYGSDLPEAIKKSILGYENLNEASKAALSSSIADTIRLQDAMSSVTQEQVKQSSEFNAALADLSATLADYAQVQDESINGINLTSEIDAVQEFADAWGIDVVEAYKLATKEAKEFSEAADEAASKTVDLDKRARESDLVKSSPEAQRNLDAMVAAADAYNAAMASISEAQSELIKNMRELEAKSAESFEMPAQELLDLYNELGSVGGSVIKDGILQPKLWQRIAEIAASLGISVVDGINLASQAMRDLVEEQKKNAEEVSQAWNDLFAGDQAGTKEFQDALAELGKQLVSYGDDQDRVKRAIEEFAEAWNLDLIDAIGQASGAMSEASQQMQADIDATREAWEEYNKAISGEDSAMKAALKDLAAELNNLEDATVPLSGDLSGLGQALAKTGSNSKTAADLIEEFAEKWGLELPEAIRLAMEAMKDVEEAQESLVTSAEFASAGVQTAWEDLVQGLVFESDAYKASLEELSQQLYLLRNNTQAMKPIIVAFANQWGLSLQEAVSISATAIQSAAAAVKAAADKAAREAEARLEKIRQRALQVKEAFQDLFDTFLKESDPYKAALESLGEKLYNHQGDVEYVKKTIEEFAKAWGIDLVDAIGEAKSAFLDFIRGHNKFSDWWSGIGSTAEDLAKEREFIAGMVARFGGLVGSAPNNFKSLPGFVNGADFIVGGKSGIDQNVVAFRATKGERVTVTPQESASRSSNVYVTYNNYAPIYGDPSKKTGDKLAAAVAEGYNRAARRGQVVGLRK